MAAKAITVTVPATQEGWITRLTLAKVCKTCHGGGLVESERWKVWNYQNSFGERDDPYPDEPEELDCVECDGTGLQLTDDGKAVLDLVRTFKGYIQ